jgi:D-inositol-3-phosphate glycosyltransferase
MSQIGRVGMISVHTSPVSVLGGGDAGGLNVYVRELARQLGQRGIDVDIFTRKTDPDTLGIVEIDERVNVISVAAGPPEPMDKNDLFRVLPEFAGEVALHALRNGIHYDVFHSHYWLSGWVNHLLQRFWSIPTVHMYHTLAHMKNRVAQPEHREQPFRLQIERQLVHLIDHFIAPNPDEERELHQVLGAPESKICTIPPGIDLDLFHPGDSREAREELGLPENPLVLFVGRIDPIKGLDRLLDAFAQLRSMEHGPLPPKLVIVGGELSQDGPARRLGNDLEPVAVRAKELGILDDVIFRGAQPQPLLPLYYRAATLCAVPSRYESFGLVAVEAMACGLPIVAFRVGGMKFTVDQCRSGILVKPGNTTLMAEAMHEIITNPHLRGTLQVGARQAAIRFSWDSVTAALLYVYEQLADGQREDLCCNDIIFQAS